MYIDTHTNICIIYITSLSFYLLMDSERDPIKQPEFYIFPDLRKTQAHTGMVAFLWKDQL